MMYKLLPDETQINHEALEQQVQAMRTEQGDWPSLHDHSDYSHLVHGETYRLLCERLALNLRSEAVATIQAKAKPEYQATMIASVLAQTDITWWMSLDSSDPMSVVKAAMQADGSIPADSAPAAKPAKRCARCGETDASRFGDAGQDSQGRPLCDDCEA